MNANNEDIITFRINKQLKEELINISEQQNKNLSEYLRGLIYKEIVRMAGVK